MAFGNDHDKTILIVDNDKANIDNYSQTIRLHFPGVKILSTSKGTDVFDIALKEKPDLILLDALISEMGGFLICEKLRANKETSSILLLMISAALANIEGRVIGLNIGADACMGKPVEKRELIAQVEAFFRISDTLMALKDARKEAEAAAQIKGRFLAQMSHEIRTPMNAVIGMTEMLSATEMSAEQWDLVDTIKKSGESLLNLINNILDFSKIESSKMKVRQHEFVLSHCVEDVIDLLAYNARGKELKLTARIDPSVPEMIRSDFDRLRQVLVNLVSNAIKFTDEGEVSLEVSTVEPSSAKGYKNDKCRLRFSVKDTGIGIAKENQSMLFDAFSQVDSSDTRRFEGTGLGLAISKGVVELMGGEIGMESAEGKGSVFFFELPVSISHASDHPVDISVGKHREGFPDMMMSQKYPLSILLVEDNLVNQKVAIKMLEKLGYHVDVAENGAVALERLNDRQYDVVFMDIQMPVMDGWETTFRIRRDIEKECQPCIVAMTAEAIGGDRQKCLDAGMNAYVSKPIRLALLVKVLKLAFKKSH